MIRNAVIHLNNEQPLLADLPTAPSAGDISLVCTNLRTLNGKRPVFADHDDSLFVFPYVHIRFLEVPAAALAAAGRAGDDGSSGSEAGNGHHPNAAAILAARAVASAEASAADGDDDGRVRTGPNGHADASGVDEPQPDATPDDDLDVDLELDEDFLRRVREI